MAKRKFHIERVERYMLDLGPATAHQVRKEYKTKQPRYCPNNKTIGLILSGHGQYAKIGYDNYNNTAHPVYVHKDWLRENHRIAKDLEDLLDKFKESATY